MTSHVLLFWKTRWKIEHGYIIIENKNYIAIEKSHFPSKLVICKIWDNYVKTCMFWKKKSYEFWKSTSNVCQPWTVNQRFFTNLLCNLDHPILFKFCLLVFWTYTISISNSNGNTKELETICVEHKNPCKNWCSNRISYRCKCWQRKSEILFVIPY